MIPAGTRIRFEVAGEVSGGWFPAPSVSAVRSEALAILGGHFNVQTLEITDAAGVLWTGLFDPRYTAVVVADVRGSYDTIADVKSLIRHAFWEASGTEPTVSVPAYGDPGQPIISTGPETSTVWGLAILVVAIAVIVVVVKV